MAAINPLAGGMPPPPPIVPPLGAPAAPQLPFAPDPSSFTGWILRETAENNAEDISLEIERKFARLDGIPDPDDAGFNEAMRGVVEEILSSEMFEPYLLVSNTPHEEARVTVLHSMYRYSAGFGGANALHGRIIGLLGEMVMEQLPTMVAIRNGVDENLAHAFTLEHVVAPTNAAVQAYFQTPLATNLMNPVTAANGGVDLNLTCLCPIPVAWAPYFLDFKHPYAALQTGEALVATLPTAAQRARADPMLDWLRTSTRRYGNGPAERGISVLDLALDSVTPPPRVIAWMNRKTNQFRLPVVVPGRLAAGDNNEARALGVPAARLGEREFTALEQEKIMSACTITEDEWDTLLPELYPRMLTEGRTTANIRALLVDILRPRDPSLLSAVNIDTTDEMAKDVKELNFGFGMDVTYRSCHRGISPFAVVVGSMAKASMRNRLADRMRRATMLSVADIENSDSTPDPIPTSFTGLMDLLNRYTIFLERVVGLRCNHRAMVMRVALALRDQASLFENITPRQVASLLWAIFIDARRFFSSAADVTTGVLPSSNLTFLVSQVQSGFLSKNSGVPYEDLVPATGPMTARQAAGTMPSGEATGSSQKVYTNVPSALKAALAGARVAYPKVTIKEMLQAANMPYQQVRLGPPGSCMDFLALGKCRDPKCNYKHDNMVTLREAQVNSAAPKLKQALEKYQAANPGGKS